MVLYFSYEGAIQSLNAQTTTPYAHITSEEGQYPKCQNVHISIAQRVYLCSYSDIFNRMHSNQIFHDFLHQRNIVLIFFILYVKLN